MLFRKFLLSGKKRSEGSSRFKVFKWLPQYLRWYIYGLSTTWLRKKKFKKNVLITGGSGFIGSAITEYIVKNKFNAIVFDNNSRGNFNIFIENKKKN